MSIEIVPHNKCTSCMACMVTCPPKAIDFVRDPLDNLYPKVNKLKCVNCSACEKVCQALYPIKKNNTPLVFAGWSTNQSIRLESASGGLSSELYLYCLNANIDCFGVSMDSEYNAIFIKLSSSNDIYLTRNSKYVFSSKNIPFLDLQESLQKGKRAMFIGLPCQVAAIIRFLEFKKINTDKLITVDLVCHGVCSDVYLKKHISYLKLKNHGSICFREPKNGTDHFYLSIKDKNNKFLYLSSPKRDRYLLGYHNGLTYRKNCYECAYASKNRVSDLTLSDFSGLGMVNSFSGNTHNINCILVNTAKGKWLLDEVCNNKTAYIEKRPSEEAFCYEKQLIAPTTANKKRELFETKYIKFHDFDKAMFACYWKEILIETLKKAFGYYFALNTYRKVKNGIKK